MSEVGEIVGRRIREARDAKGMTQAGLAEATGLAVETISRMERGRQSPRLDHLVAVATALATTAGRIVDGSDPPPQESVLPREVNRLAQLLRAKDETTQRRARQLVELALLLSES